MKKQRGVLAARNESQVFAWPQLIQASESKPDMYYAIWKPTGVAVVVRGPYLKSDQAEIEFRLQLDAFRRLFVGVTPMPWISGKWAVPDLETKPSDGESGTRVLRTARDCIEPRRTYPFLVMTDLRHPYRKGPCKAADRSLVKTVCLRDLMMHRNPEARRNFLVAVLFLYVWEIPNTHYKDLLWNPATCQFWSLGEAMPEIGMAMHNHDLFGQELKQGDRRIMAQILIDHWHEVRDNYVRKWTKVPDLPIAVVLTARSVCKNSLEAMVALI